MSKAACDYLVIGTGAVGMAFVDTMLEESDATFLMVDNHHQPGGHWNDAYPFVRLHQPSHFYGVASTQLGSKRIDASRNRLCQPVPLPDDEKGFLRSTLGNMMNQPT